MPLLLLNDQNTIDDKNEFRTRTPAAEACRVPEQTNNNEGCGKDLQIGSEKITLLRPPSSRQPAQKSPRTVWAFKTIAR